MMPSLNTQAARLRTMALRAESCRTRLSEFQPESTIVEDQVADLESDLKPKFQELSSQLGEDLIKLATNFTKDEFCLLWFRIESKMRQNWNARSGQRSKVHPIDGFFFTVTHF